LDNSLISNLSASINDLEEDLNLGEEKTKSILEVLVINVLNNFSFTNNNRTTKADATTKQEFQMLIPIILKDEEGKEISIFSNETENYFNGGVVYRFLRCLTNIYLNERGLVLSKTETDNIAR